MGPAADAPLLSICIPTWNRLEVLKVCLDSIVRELAGVPGGRVEVVVSDNASTDGTQAYCQALQERHPFFRNARNPENIFILNFMAAVDQGRGTYCWLLGDDDALHPGVLKQVLDALASGHDVYLGPRLACDKDLQPVLLQTWHSGAIEPEWDLGTAQERARYFNQCTSLGGCFGFISSQIFRLASWQAVPLPKGPGTGDQYPHVYRILAFAATSLRLRLLDFPLVLGRIPDLDADVPDWNRTFRDIPSMLEVAEALGYRRNKAVWDAFFGILRRTHAGDHYPRMIRLQAPDEATWRFFVPRLVQIGYAAPYLEALDRAFKALPLGTRPLLPMPAGTDLGVTVAMEHMAFLLHGVKALALVSLGSREEALEADALRAALNVILPDLPVLRVVPAGFEPLDPGPGDRILAVAPQALEGSPEGQRTLTSLCRELEVGLVLNTGHPRTRPSDIACAVMPAYARLGLPGADPRVDPLYTGVLPEALLSGAQGCAVIQRALGF